MLYTYVAFKRLVKFKYKKEKLHYNILSGKIKQNQVCILPTGKLILLLYKSLPIQKSHDAEK